MLTDGIQFLGSGSVAENFKVASGSDLPTSGNSVGKLFYRTTAPAGLYVYKQEGWAQVGGVATWGQISGTLANQTDLASLFGTKQDKSEKGQANGYLGLNAQAKVDLTALATTGSASATTYLRGDGAWATPEGGGQTGIGPDYRYDLSFANPGLVSAGKVFMLVAPRAFKLLASGHRGIAFTAPADAVTFDVWRRSSNGTLLKVGTINWAAGAVAATSSIVETNFGIGDTLYMELLTADPSMMDVTITLMAHITQV